MSLWYCNTCQTLFAPGPTHAACGTPGAVAKTDLDDLFRDHLFDYEFNGLTYCFTLPALSREEAEARVRALAATAKWVGVTEQIVEMDE